MAVLPEPSPLMLPDVGMIAPPTLLQNALARVAEEVDGQLDLLLQVPDDPRAMLFRAMRHAAIGGGKRIRPLLTLATAELFNVDRNRALRVATAIECIHVYSLVHDDMPAMDDDDMRRGRPTVHKAFDEATAILVGDGLQALAFEILADADTSPDPFVRAELVLEIARAAGPQGMVGGQALDLSAERDGFDLHTITKLQQLKTGALISASVEAGAILGRLPPEGRLGLRGFARDVGLAFQIVDDLLDVEGDEETAGKTLNKDADAGKATFLTLMGADRAREQAEMLVDQAIAHLKGFGDEAALLRAVARFVIERDR